MKYNFEKNLELALDGDHQAFQRILVNEVPYLLNEIQRIMLSQQGSVEAVDIYQDTLVKAWLKLSTYNIEYKFSTWIYRIARNTYTDHYRKHVNVHMVSVDALQEREMNNDFSESQRYEIDFTDENRNPMEQLIHDEAISQLHNFIREIGKKNRGIAELLTLRHVYDKSYKEIIKLTGKPEGTIKGNLNRGREMLAKMYGVARA